MYINIESYIESHSTEESKVLEELFRETHLHAVHPRMVSGHIQGRLLSLLSRLKQPHRILEIGTYTGYSAICLAEGLKTGGKLISIEINDELEAINRKNIEKAGMCDKVQLITGDAKTIIPELTDEFELIFIDGNKQEYPEYYELSKSKLASGGLLIADNALWSGKVIKTATDPQTREIQKFNNMVQEDPSMRNFILPVRDGLMIAEKIQA
ncbi:MAG: O-methyltransferase [Candidatus Delongbacteria bacterium]|jgi:caffeoyl-CoA O-methyltransferase|nr:O-methyltransferase [Candidatus Delongbacteria bacterium]